MYSASMMIDGQDPTLQLAMHGLPGQASCTQQPHRVGKLSSGYTQPTEWLWTVSSGSRMPAVCILEVFCNEIYFVSLV